MRKLESGVRGISHIIVDEVHERSCDTDFLLIVLRDMLALYPDLRVILMSATFDDALFTKYFNNCPVINVEGRAFPVQTYFLEDVVEMLQFEPSSESLKKNKRRRQDGEEGGDEENFNILPSGLNYTQSTYRSMQLMQERGIDLELLAALLRYIREMNVPGSILVFLPGWNDIFAIMKYLSEHPLFGNISADFTANIHLS